MLCAFPSALKKETTEVANMKFQNRMKLQALVMACGAALCFASSTFGQEIVNTQFPDGPNVVPLSQNTALDASTAASPASSETIPAGAIDEPVANQASAIPVEAVIPSISMILSLCLLVVYAFAKTKRSYSTPDDRMGHPNTVS